MECKFTERIEDRGLKPILDIMEAMGGWPAVKSDAWDESKWTWEQAIIDCRKNGYSNDFILDFSVGNDLKNSSNKLVDVSSFFNHFFAEINQSFSCRSINQISVSIKFF